MLARISATLGSLAPESVSSISRASLRDSGEAKGSGGSDLGLRPWKQEGMWRWADNFVILNGLLNPLGRVSRSSQGHALRSR